MKGPSIAVMLAGKSKDNAEDGGEPGLAEAKSSAVDASKALMRAVAARDAEGVYRAFRSLSTLCREIDDLEDSGESEDEAPESMEDEASSAEE
jgi:hypothetical protein